MGLCQSALKKKNIYYSKQEQKISDKGINNFKYLVIEGGGMKIIPASGCIRALDEYGVLNNLIKFAGSSAGAILASVLACGYTPTEIDNIMIETDFTKFQDDDFGFIRDSFRIINNYGLCPGEYFLKWMDDKIKLKLGKKNATFQDLKKQTNKFLYITSLCVDDDKLCIFSFENTPNMIISQAVRMSVSIPFFYCPVLFENKYYIDGGISNNYPIDLFDKKGEENNKTLGIKLMGAEEKRDNKIFYSKYNTQNLLHFSSSILSHLFNEMERKEINANYWKRTISVNTGNIGIIEFDISYDKRLKHVKKSYVNTKNSLDKYIKKKTF